MKHALRAFVFTCAFTVCFRSSAPAGIVFIVDAPQDDGVVRKLLSNNEHVSRLGRAWDDLQTAFLWPLRSSQVAAKFGPKLKKLPDPHVLPAFEGQVVVTSGLTSVGPNRRHVDVYALGPIGYVELYFHQDGETMETAMVYFRPDGRFVPLKAKADIPKRVAWEKEKFALTKSWMKANLPDHTAEVRQKAILDAQQARADKLRERGFDSGICPVHHVPLRQIVLYTWSHGPSNHFERYPPARLQEKYPMSTLSYYERLSPSGNYQRPKSERICLKCQRLFEAETKADTVGLSSNQTLEPTPDRR